jgi:C4-dicarboxylate-specific signal transduction histidine kinase
MPRTAATEAIDPARRLTLRKLSDKQAQRPPTVDQPVKHLGPTTRESRDKEGHFEYIGAVQDLARRRLPEEALSKARSELAHVARVTSLGVLTASIAHEINQPLASIITNGETGLRRLARPELDVEKIRELTRRMVAEARRAAEIIDRIRAMATRRPPQQTRLSLGDIIEESMVFLRHEFKSKGISVALDLAPLLPPVVGDRTQLQQVIVNLALNAVQAMESSGAARKAILIRTLLPDPETVCCNIEDSGPGIDPAHLPHLFDSFFTTKDAGMGMGLAISRSIIEAHDGHIGADNNSSLCGARFSFALPAGDAAWAATRLAAESQINIQAPLEVSAVPRWKAVKNGQVCSPAEHGRHH